MKAKEHRIAQAVVTDQKTQNRKSDSSFTGSYVEQKDIFQKSHPKYSQNTKKVEPIYFQYPIKSYLPKNLESHILLL